MVQPRERAPLTYDQRIFVRVAARQLEIGLVLLKLEVAAEKAARRRAKTPEAETPTPLPTQPRQRVTCPSQGRYRRHRKDGENCDVCLTFMRAKWVAFRAAHPEWRQRSDQRYRDKAAARTPETTAADVAESAKDAA